MPETTIWQEIPAKLHKDSTRSPEGVPCGILVEYRESTRNHRDWSLWKSRRNAKSPGPLLVHSLWKAVTSSKVSCLKMYFANISSTRPDMVILILPAGSYNCSASFWFLSCDCGNIFLYMAIRFVLKNKQIKMKLLCDTCCVTNVTLLRRMVLRSLVFNNYNDCVV